MLTDHYVFSPLSANAPCSACGVYPHDGAHRSGMRFFCSAHCDFCRPPAEMTEQQRASVGLQVQGVLEL